MLWEAIARRYRDQPWVAGYDLINEPADPTGKVVAPFFLRLRDAVRKIDPAHVLFIEGNTYARDFDRFDPTWKWEGLRGPSAGVSAGGGGTRGATRPAAPLTARGG